MKFKVENGDFSEYKTTSEVAKSKLRQELATKFEKAVEDGIDV